ncbi:MAG: hypothetical protein WAN52_24940 [Pseudolabrys sp.]
MLGLTDAQLEIITTAANAVPVERRSVFLERVGAMLKVRGRFSDADVSDVAKLATAGLIQHTADSVVCAWRETPGLRGAWECWRPGTVTLPVRNHHHALK